MYAMRHQCFPLTSVNENFSVGFPYKQEPIKTATLESNISINLVNASRTHEQRAPHDRVIASSW